MGSSSLDGRARLFGPADGDRGGRKLLENREQKRGREGVSFVVVVVDFFSFDHRRLMIFRRPSCARRESGSWGKGLVLPNIRAR